MPPSSRLLPGPTGTSCLTCKRRHKKCDRQRPVCDRCSKGGYECLGYEHNNSNRSTNHEVLPSDHRAKLADSRSRLLGSSILTSSPHNESPRSDGTSMSGDMVDNCSNAESPTLPGMAHERRDISDLLAFYDEAAVIYDTFPPTRPKTRVSENKLPLPLDPVNAVIAQRPVFPASPLLFQLASRVSKIVPTPPDIRDVTEYVISQFDRMLKITYFTPQGDQIEKLHKLTIWRMSTCNFARQGMLIDARIHDSVLEGSDLIHSSEFTRLIDEFEHAVRARLNEPLSAFELQERLNDVLEAFFVRGRLINAASTYELFCKVMPNFLQIVYVDPKLWSTASDPTLVSLAHLLTTPRYGLACYALMDIKGSMIYGVPQLVRYDTEIELFHTEPHPVEWFDCIPGEFLILLAKINVCRDQRSTEDWWNIEQRLVSWEPRPRFEPKGLESWKLVAWRALQETWRRTLLIYLYIAVCEVPTDDPRIQSSLRQIFQLFRVIRRQDPPISNVHVFSQCLIAGICSRTEKQRRLVRERLGCTAETRLWMFRGPEIVPVLDHLWLGVGMEGRPVMWSDYLYSRRTVLPLSR